MRQDLGLETALIIPPWYPKRDYVSNYFLCKELKGVMGQGGHHSTEDGPWLI